MTRIIFTLAAVVALYLPASAMAGGLSPIVPEGQLGVPEEIVTSFDLDVYVAAGIGEAEYDGDYDTVGKHGETVIFDLDGQTSSVAVGIRHQFDSNFIVGLEAQFTALGHSDETACHGTCRTCDVESDGIYDITVTAGYVAGNFNFYGLAGVAKTSGSVSVANVGNFATVAELDAQRQDYESTGTVVGLGIEYSFNESFSVGIEANQFDFDTVETDSNFYDSVDFDPSSKNIQVRAVYTF